MLTRIVLFIFEQFLRIGCLHMVIANGPAHSLKGDLAGPDITTYLTNRRLFWRILVKPDLAIGEAYMDGSLTIANDDLEQFIALLMANNSHWQKHWLARMGLFAGTYLAFWNFFNLPRRAKLMSRITMILRIAYLTNSLTRVVNILAAISIRQVTRLPMHKSPSWRALGQSYVYSRIRRFLILAVDGAGLPMRCGKCSRIFR